MNKTLKLGLIIAATIGSTAAVQANLIVNGDFEQGPGLGGAFNFSNGGAVTPGTGNWDYYSAIPGWTPVAPTPPNNPPVTPVLEVGRASVYGVKNQDGSSYSGGNVMELDTTANVGALQVAGTTGNFTLSFLYALRQGRDPSSGKIEVYWNGTLLQTLQPTDQKMTLYTSIPLVGSITGNSLKFVGAGTSDTYGALIDNVVLVPEPSTYIAGGLALLPLLFGLRARWNKKA
jgi:hypothetical protein